MFIKKSKFNELQNDVKSLKGLKEKVRRLEFIAENPPKFKKGDKIGNLTVIKSGLDWSYFELLCSRLERYYICYNSAVNETERYYEDNLEKLAKPSKSSNGNK